MIVQGLREITQRTRRSPFLAPKDNTNAEIVPELLVRKDKCSFIGHAKHAEDRRAPFRTSFRVSNRASFRARFSRAKFPSESGSPTDQGTLWKAAKGCVAAGVQVPGTVPHRQARAAAPRPVGFASLRGIDCAAPAWLRAGMRAEAPKWAVPLPDGHWATDGLRWVGAAGATRRRPGRLSRGQCRSSA